MSLHRIFCREKERELRAQGIKYIKYTKYGVPFPDWDRILKEALYDENGKLKKVAVREKDGGVVPYGLAVNICRNAEQVNFITGVDRYDGEKAYCDMLFVYKDNKKYLVVRDCGKIVYCKEIKKEKAGG